MTDALKELAEQIGGDVSVDLFELGQAAIEPLLDRRGLREPLQGIKYDDPDIWEDICRATGNAALLALLSQAEKEEL